MKRAVLCAALFLTWLAARPEATAYKCILTNKCTPPPCEFLAHLNLAKARRRAIAKASAPLTADPKAFLAYTDELLAARAKAYKAYRKCSAAELPSIAVGPAPACSVTPSLQDALKLASTCSEAVDAEYARAEMMQSLCQQTGRDAATVAELRARHLLGAQARIDSLEASLVRYLGSCVPDATLSRELSRAGLGALLNAGQEARDRWKARRAGPSPAYDPSGLLGPGR